MLAHTLYILGTLVIGAAFGASIGFLAAGAAKSARRYDHESDHIYEDQLRKNSMAPLLIGALLLAFFCPAPAEALTKQECIRAGYGCQWSKATGGKTNGWFYATGKKPADGKPSKSDAKPAPIPSSTTMSAVVDAVASALGGTNRQSSTPGSKKENVRNADGSRLAIQHPQGVALRLAPDSASRSAMASQRHPGRSMEPQAEAQTQERQAPKITQATARPDEDMRRVTAFGDGRSGRPGGVAPATGTNFPRLPDDCPQARINEAFAALGIRR